MRAREFHNALRIMSFIEVCELKAAGVIDENWGEPAASSRNQLVDFIKNPYREAIRMPDVNFDRLFALIQSRQPRRKS